MNSLTRAYRTLDRLPLWEGNPDSIPAFTLPPLEEMQSALATEKSQPEEPCDRCQVHPRPMLTLTLCRSCRDDLSQ